MSNVNYNDLYKVYHHINDTVEISQPIVSEEVREDPEEDFEGYEEGYEEVENEVEREEDYYPPVVMRTVVDDPLRDLAQTAAGYAVGYGIAEFLGIFSKGDNYVGNQHISSMSDERVREYRRRGLLPPG